MYFAIPIVTREYFHNRTIIIETNTETPITIPKIAPLKSLELEREFGCIS